MSTPPPVREPSEQVASTLAFWLVLFGVPTLWLNRALIPALPGSRSGIEVLLDRAYALGSISSQLLALVITLLLIRLIVSSIGAAAIGALERLFVLPIGSAVGFLVIAASAGPLDPELHLLLAAVSSVGLLICARPALRHASTRAGGILLACIIVASMCFATARLVALHASVEAVPRQYAAARWLATAGQVFDSLSLLWVATWLVISERTRGMVRVALILSATIALLILAQLGQREATRFAPILVARALGALGREPSPFGHAFIGPASDVLAPFLSLAILSVRSSANQVLRRAMALLLLGRCSLDVPALAGMATAGALLLAWFTPQPSTSGPSSSGSCPTPRTPSELTRVDSPSSATPEQ